MSRKIPIANISLLTKSSHFGVNFFLKKHSNRKNNFFFEYFYSENKSIRLFHNEIVFLENIHKKAHPTSLSE